MMLNKLTACMILMLLPLSSYAADFDPCADYPWANKIDVTVLSSVSEVEGGFAYSYILSSLSTSRQETRYFTVEYRSPVINGLAPEEWNIYDNKKSILLKWRARPIEHNIKPGETLRGFGFESVGLPSVVNYYSKGYIPLENLPVAPEGEAPEDPCPQMVLETGSVQGLTLGPTAPPKELKPVEFLDNIISMKHEAFKLGWITNEAIELSLDVKLDHIKKKLQSGDIKTASNMLKAFINEVEAQGCETYDDCPKGKHVKPEAYALLKYNAQYLADNMK